MQEFIDISDNMEKDKVVLIDLLDEIVVEAFDEGFEKGYKEGMYDSLPANVSHQYRLRAKLSDADI
jgi:hypothetical protein